MKKCYEVYSSVGYENFNIYFSENYMNTFLNNKYNVTFLDNVEAISSSDLRFYDNKSNQIESFPKENIKNISKEIYNINPNVNYLVRIYSYENYNYYYADIMIKEDGECDFEFLCYSKEKHEKEESQLG